MACRRFSSAFAAIDLSDQALLDAATGEGPDHAI